MQKRIFSALTRVFSNESPEIAAGPDSEAVAIAALLVEAARADGDFAPEERAAIERSLSARWGEDAADILASAEAAVEDASDTHRFTRLVKQATAPEDRMPLIEDLWMVILADGVRDDSENALMRRLAGLLHVPDRDIALARQRVEARG